MNALNCMQPMGYMFSMETKTCTKCGEEKPLALFYRHKKSKDGLTQSCKSCVNVRVAEYRATPKGREVKRSSERRRSQTEHGKASARARVAKYSKTDAGFLTRKRYFVSKRPTERYRKENPEKYEAHKKVQIALLMGWLTRQPCIKCDEKADAHHEDYSKPLEIVWLCRAHHKERHREIDATKGVPHVH